LCVCAARRGGERQIKALQWKLFTTLAYFKTDLACLDSDFDAFRDATIASHGRPGFSYTKPAFATVSAMMAPSAPRLESLIVSEFPPLCEGIRAKRWVLLRSNSTAAPMTVQTVSRSSSTHPGTFSGALRC
jgi:hypothetical protein